MAKIVGHAGPDSGRSFDLVSNEAGIGRNPSNEIALHDMSISRFHARVIRRAGIYFIRDAGSSMGTVLNGQPVHGEMQLHQSDVIALGESELVLQLTPEEQAATEHKNNAGNTPTMFRNGGTAHTTSDGRTIAFSLPIAKAEDPDTMSGMRSDVLAKIATALRSAGDIDALLAVLMEALFEVFKPDQGVILLASENEGEFEAKVQRPDNAPAPISQTIVDHAVAERMVVLVADTADDNRFSNAQSIMELSIRAAICSPLIYHDRVLGAVYLDTRVNLFAYKEEDLTLLNFIAANAAMAIENAMLREDKLKNERLSEKGPGPLVAESPAMKEVAAKLEEAARATEPVFVTGPTGAGKLFAAKTIHRLGCDPQAPFILVDCAELRGADAAKALLGSAGEVQDETKPRGAGAGSSSSGLVHRANGGTLVLQHVGALDPDLQRQLANYLAARRDPQKNVPRPRVVTTNMVALESLAEEDRFLPGLAKGLSAGTIEIPPMAKRKADIIPLANHFLAHSPHRHRGRNQQFDASAVHALRRLRFRNENCRELRRTVEFTTLLADGEEIGAEHVFSGPTDRGHRAQFDLGESGLLSLLVRGPLHELLRVGVLVFFAGLATLCLAMSQSAIGGLANSLVWGLWWPSLIVAFLLIGRIWCPICPVSTAGQLTQKLHSFRLGPPDWMKKTTHWLSPMLFLLVIWTEHVFQMPSHAFATGIFLLTLMVCGVGFCLVYQREVWCRYLCPLGGLSACYSVPALLDVHATPSICASQCKTHECFKGSGEEEGCPVFHHPLYQRDAHFCKLCLHCLRVCPHGSVRPYLHPPLQDVWRAGEFGPTLIPFALVAFFMSLVMLASHREIPGVAGPVGFTILTAVAVGLAVALNAVLPGLLTKERDAVVVSRVGFALMVLAWGPFLAFHLQNVPGLDAVGLSLSADSLLGRSVGATSLSLRLVLQLGSVFVGMVLAAFTFWRLRTQVAKEGLALLPWGWRVLYGVCVIYCLISIALTYTGGTRL